MRYQHGRLLQFARYPELGKVKTRLSPYLSDKEILRVHCQLVRECNKNLALGSLAEIDLWLGGNIPNSDNDHFLQGLDYQRIKHQCQGDLGQRMYQAIATTLSTQKIDKALLVGSDCPFISADIFIQAFEMLAKGSDLVLGPAHDGGYYLIGMSKAHQCLFEGIHWGTETVLDETLDRVRAAGLRYSLLPALSDIDLPQDLGLLISKNEFSWLKKYFN